MEFYKSNTNVNKGLNYEFNGSISREVLNNYLSRAMMYSINKIDEGTSLNEEWLRVILSTGTKFANRFVGSWLPSAMEEAQFPKVKENIERAHKMDPDIIFEACIFETAYNGMNGIKIPEYVFKAFGVKTENRNFDYKKMLYEKKTLLEGCLEVSDTNHWGEGVAIPDITRTETQMFIYYRACTFIDMGIESFHLGQTNLVGTTDKNNECWTKVIGMIRDYAKKNARRKYVLINSHHPDHSFKNAEGVFLVDFDMFPARLHAKPGSKDHLPSEDNPQECIIQPKSGDSSYLNIPGGTTPSGWKCKSLPYLVEFDNCGGLIGTEGKASELWGYDEISWFASQPDWYRRKFLSDLYEQIKGFGDDGHLQMPGRRGAYVHKLGKFDRYYVDSREYNPNGFGDEETVIEIWKNDLKNR